MALKLNKRFPFLSRRSPYQYCSFDEKVQEIRLLTLLAGTFKSKIRILLHVTRFTEDSVPQFEALSYAWGSVEDRKDIFIVTKGHRALAVTQNLESALRHLRYEDTDRVIWIDAICVNQEDLEERSRQVRRMADIYSKATSVLIWLGPEADQSSQALDLLNDLGSRVVVDWRRHSMAPSSIEASEAHWSDTNVEIPYNELEIVSISNLIHRSWFERLWVWQEVHSASNGALLICGTKAIPWSYFQDAAYCVYTKLVAPYDVVPTTFQQRIKLVFNICGINRNLGLRDVLNSTRHTKCSDPRDRVFALQSLLRGTDKVFMIEPDYTKDVSEIYRDTVQHFIETGQSLDILTAVNFQERDHGLPTWVTDFSNPPLSSNLDLGFASNESTAMAHFKDRMLQVTGISVGKIDCVTKFSLAASRLDEIRRVATALSILHLLTPRSKQLREFCKLLCIKWSERFYPPGHGFPSLVECERVIHRILSSHNQYEELRIAPSYKHLMDCIGYYCPGRSFYATHDGYIGLAPAGARPGDLVVVLLGCNSAMILRPTSNGQYRVVGESYCAGVMDGEAFLGTFSDGWELRYQFIERRQSNYWSFFNSKTGKLQVEDPRLGPLPQPWGKKSHEFDDVWNIFVNDETGEETERDPRLKPEALMERGVEFRTFDLI